MFREKLSLIIFYLFASSLCITHSELLWSPFVKKSNSYESTIENSAAVRSSVPGYFEKINEILNKYSQSEVTYEALNKFGEGLDQLFLYKYYQKIYEEKISNQKVNNVDSSDSITLPNFVDDNSGLEFKELTVYTFPTFKRGAKPKLNHDALRSSLEFKVSNRYTSDNLILTGSFYIEGHKYFFLHRLTSPVYAVEVLENRNPGELISGKLSLSYDKEDFVHTYDSSYDNFTSINSILNEATANKLLPYVLSEIGKRNAEDLKNQALKLDFAHVKIYERLILEGLTKSALEYVKGYIKLNNGADTFISSDIVYNVDSATAPVQFQQKTQNIQLKGFFNYVNTPKPVFSNTSLSDGGRLYNMSQGIEFEYAEAGDKQAIVSYTLNTGKREFHRQVKVKSITFISEYLAELSKKPFQVYRNKDVFFNKAGFLIRIETYDGDPVYDYVWKHIGNDIARKIQTLVQGSTADVV